MQSVSIPSIDYLKTVCQDYINMIPNSTKGLAVNSINQAFADIETRLQQASAPPTQAPQDDDQSV